jgi:hypothetical protein
MLYREIIAVFSQIHTKHIKTQSVPRIWHCCLHVTVYFIHNANKQIHVCVCFTELVTLCVACSSKCRQIGGWQTDRQLLGCVWQWLINGTDRYPTHCHWRTCRFVPCLGSGLLMTRSVPTICQSVWDLWWTKWLWDIFYFPCRYHPTNAQYSFIRLSREQMIHLQLYVVTLQHTFQFVAVCTAALFWNGLYTVLTIYSIAK